MLEELEQDITASCPSWPQKVQSDVLEDDCNSTLIKESSLEGTHIHLPIEFTPLNQQPVPKVCADSVFFPAQWSKAGLKARRKIEKHDGP